jgi:hypothetical protein
VSHLSRQSLLRVLLVLLSLESVPFFSSISSSSLILVRSLQASNFGSWQPSRLLHPNRCSSGRIHLSQSGLAKIRVPTGLSYLFSPAFCCYPVGLPSSRLSVRRVLFFVLVLLLLGSSPASLLSCLCVCLDLRPCGNVGHDCFPPPCSSLLIKENEIITS